jgi:1-acyl-sn-glycerol-3-phosphate acyltransferase
VETSGLDHIPEHGPVLLVGNHSGGLSTPDTGMVAHAWFMERGVDAPIFALVHKSIFSVPFLNVHIQKLGGVAATARMAIAAIERGGPVLIYPGGGREAYRPWAERNTIKLCGNDAFVRLALRYRVPIVPVVALGGHETLIVLDEGRMLAEKLGLAGHGVERIPLTLSLPFGLGIGLSAGLPAPAKILIEIGTPIELIHRGANASSDASFVRAAYDHVVSTMQAMLDGLVVKRAARDRQASAPPPGRDAPA